MKEDVAEVLRRRFFEPDSIRDATAFRPHVTSAVGSIAKLDEQTKEGTADRRGTGIWAAIPFTRT